ncbi:MAG TPA: hypothetical protein DCZ80_03805 [Legionellales bacterium]|nr:hypothetical protein [Legionellales bacterium]
MLERRKPLIEVNMTEINLYPGTVAVKVFIRDDENIKNEITAIVQKAFPKFKEQDISTQLSANKNFLSITYIIYVENKEEIDNLYQKIIQHPEVKMVL